MNIQALEDIKRDPGTYVDAARMHTLGMGEGPGALFASITEDGAVFTFFLPMKAVRAQMRDKGAAWLRWYKREVRPVLRSYDPECEAVVLTRHQDGPKVTVLRS